MKKSRTSKLLIIITLLVALFLFGCLDQTYRPAAYRGNATITAEQPSANINQETQAAAQVTTNNQQTTSTQTQQGTSRTTTSQNQTQPAPNPYQQPPEHVAGVQYFIIEADDAGIYPSTLNLNRLLHFI